MKKLLMLFTVCLFAVSSAFSQDDVYYTDDEATVEVKAQLAPPALPQYEQPACPGDGYIWTPGYWAWAPTGYYWVAGVWVMPPSAGVLWTPGYWGFYHGYYGWHRGYWGPHIGYYGGVNYGFGYYGTGFYGGRWEGNHFFYNRGVWRVNTAVVHNTYVSHEGVVRVNNGVRYSYNGPGGVHYRPAAREQEVMHETHVAPNREQVNHEQMMGGEKGQVHSNTARPATHSMNTTPNGQRYNERGRPAGGGQQQHMAHTNGGGHGGTPRGGGGHVGGGGHGGGGHGGGHGGR